MPRLTKAQDWQYENVPGLGTVILSPDVIRKLHMAMVGTRELEDVLVHGRDIRALDEQFSVSGYRQWRDIRLAFKTHPSLPGAAVVCVDGYRVNNADV